MAQIQTAVIDLSITESGNRREPISFRLGGRSVLSVLKSCLNKARVGENGPTCIKIGECISYDLADLVVYARHHSGSSRHQWLRACRSGRLLVGEVSLTRREPGRGPLSTKLMLRNRSLGLDVLDFEATAAKRLADCGPLDCIGHVLSNASAIKICHGDTACALWIALVCRALKPHELKLIIWVWFNAGSVQRANHDHLIGVPLVGVVSEEPKERFSALLSLVPALSDAQKVPARL
jgi:hypothetical protein